MVKDVATEAGCDDVKVAMKCRNMFALGLVCWLFNRELSLILLLVTLALGSSDAMMVNGEEYADKWWLHVADMFVNSSLALVVVAVVAIIVFTIKNSRRR